MNLSQLMTVSDWNYVKSVDAVYALLVAAIGDQETGWGTRGVGRPWICGCDVFPGGNKADFEGFENQIKQTVAMLQKGCSLPISQASVLEFARSYWKPGEPPTEATETAWANGVWEIYSSLNDDLSNAWVNNTPQLAVKAGLWTDVPSLTNIENPAFVRALIAQTGISAISLAEKALSKESKDVTLAPKHKYNLKPSPKHRMGPRFRATHEMPKAVPTSFFWEQLPARDQGQYPDCTGYGNADLMDRLVYSVYTAAGLTPFQTAALYIFQRGGGSDQGGVIVDMLDVLVKYGVPPEADWPISLLTPSDIDNLPTIPASVDAQATGQNIAGYSTVVDVEELQAALLIAPVAIGVQVYSNSFENCTNGVILAPNSVAGDQYMGNHDVTIDGYDETKQLAGWSTPGAFRFINSWGADWGDNGYGWIHKDLITNTDFMLEMHSVKPKVVVPAQPQPEPVPATTPTAAFTCGQNAVVMNGVDVPIDSDRNVFPLLVDQLGRMFVPVRFLPTLISFFGGAATTLTWVEETLTATMTESATDEYVELLQEEKS